MNIEPKRLLEQTTREICEDFELRDVLMHQGSEEERLAEMRKWLSEAVAEMMEHQMEQFLNTLYRLDVSEKKAVKALNHEMNAPPALALADLIIEREMQKIKSRAWYKQYLQTQKLNEDEDVERW